MHIRCLPSLFTILLVKGMKAFVVVANLHYCMVISLITHLLLHFQPSFTINMFNKIAILAVISVAFGSSEALLTNPMKTGQTQKIGSG